MKNKCFVKQAFFAAFLWCFLFSGCAVHTAFQPVGKDKLRAHFSLGGPIIKTLKIPAPYLSAGVDYGVRDDLDLNADIHLLSIAFSITGLDIGITWHPVKNEGGVPAIALQAKVASFFSLKSGVAERYMGYSMFAPSVAWELGLGNLYMGTNVTIPFRILRFDNDAPRTILSPFLGYYWQVGKKFGFSGELKWQNANWEAHQIPVSYVSLGNRGALAPIIGFEWKF